MAWGVLGALGWRWLLQRMVLLKARHDVAALNRGDYRPLLAGYAKDAVLRFHEGDHRWSGEHRGRPAIERFLQSFVAAGLQGEVREALVAGPPWRMTVVLRFDDRATSADGEVLYANRTVLLLRMRWGRLVLHEDFYEDTDRIRGLDERLRELSSA